VYSGCNLVLVKYKADGTVQWARTISKGAWDSESFFQDTAADTSGNVYTVGRITGTSSYTFGSGVTAKGVSTGDNAVIVKYLP
jgi:hypothetical protein